jgi:hypothetical protein
MSFCQIAAIATQTDRCSIPWATLTRVPVPMRGFALRLRTARSSA